MNDSSPPPDPAIAWYRTLLALRSCRGALREGRLGLMFNALFKIPMQFGIVMLGALLFVF